MSIPGALVTAEDRDSWETDYSIFRYSKFALPWLLLLLAWNVAVMVITFWFGDFDVKNIHGGIPRDYEPYAKVHDGEGNMSRQVRNLRYATAIHGLVGLLVVGLALYTKPRPKARRGCMFLAVLILFVCTVLAVIAFIMDVGSTTKANKCVTQVGIGGATKILQCEPKAGLANAAVTTDATTALFAFTSALLVAWFTKQNTLKLERRGWYEQERDVALDDPQFTEEHRIKPVVPGLSTVHRRIVFFALFGLAVSCVLLLLWTTMLHENREKIQIGDQHSAWPKENSRLRLSNTLIGQITIVLALLPTSNRVFAYLLAILFFFSAVIWFVNFAIDLRDLDKARRLPCPSGYSCIYHPYNFIVVADILIGVLIVIYLVYEYLLKLFTNCVHCGRDFAKGAIRDHERNLCSLRPVRCESCGESYTAKDFVYSHRFLCGEDAPLASQPTYEKGGKLVEVGPSPPRLRPLLGVEVIELENPNTGELNVTVMSVTPGGAAEEAGLRNGDVISRWDEFPIQCKADFAQAVSSAAIGSIVVLQVIRPPYGSIEYLQLSVRGVAA